MARIEKTETWYADVAELMARTGLSLYDAVAELGLGIESDTLNNVLRRKGFTRLLWEARHRYFDSLGKDPSFNQDVVIGRLLAQSQKLEEQGMHDKAAEVLLKIAKIRGWVGPENQVSIFGELSQEDLNKIRDTLAKENAPRTRPN